MSEQSKGTKYLRDIRRSILNSFDQEELKVIAFDLSINWDDLSGETRTTKTQALIMHFARRGQLEELVALLREERPNVDWPNLPPPEQQTLDEQTLNPAQGDWVGGDKITAGNLSDVKGVAMGREAQAANIEGDVAGMVVQAGGDVKLGKELRDEQYEIVLNWEARGKPRMREFDLSDRNLSSLNLSNADLEQANLSKAVLRGTDLSGVNLSWANLHQANLHQADLHQANMVRVDLRAADLSGADLHQAISTYADLSNSNLSAANLSGALLIRSDLSGADLRDAFLVNALLYGTNLEGANLSGATLRRVSYTAETTWPDGFDPKAAGAILVDEDGKPIEDSDD